MMQSQVNAGPQRGRRSQHHASARLNSKGNARREVEGAVGNSAEYPSPPSSPSSPITQQPGRGGLTGGLNEPHALESGFFNKYVDDKGEPSPTDHHKQLVRRLIIKFTKVLIIM